jgi:cyclic pyranopterin phosphate synthase
MIQIYTDGSYNSMLDQGGWSAVIVRDNEKHVLSGTVPKTTGNRMEITAVLEAVNQIPYNTEITIYTDSQYLLGCMTKGWRRRANLDLFEQLDQAIKKRNVNWHWIKSEDDNPLHKEAHQTAIKLATTTPAENTTELTHLDLTGFPQMVDITQKSITERVATAGGNIKMQPTTFELVKQNQLPKGNVLVTAQLAGIMAAKQTANIIPLCHPLSINTINITFNYEETNHSIQIAATVKSTGKTGVEMEALTAVTVAALTIYDMCKAVDQSMILENIRLIEKSGGKRGAFTVNK